MKNQEPFDTQYLHLIRASAGSGKTHRLTGNYLRLLFVSPTAYKHILAVTFTNKATEEMKSRIIQELYALSVDQKSDYLTQLVEQFRISETQVREKAKQILNTILHDYSSFAISTIDKFFQQTMRAFTREIGVAGGYNLELDGKAYLQQVVDTMLFELDKAENKTLTEWLLVYMKDQIEDGKSWSIKKDVLTLAQEIFNENYKSLSQNDKDKIHDKKYLTDYKKTIEKIVRNFENEVKNIGLTGANLMSRFGLHYSDFKGGSKSAFSHFVKWANDEIKEPTATFINLADNLNNWATKATAPEKQKAIEIAYFEGLNEQVKSAVSLFENSTFYHSAKCVLNYFYTLGILNDVHQRMIQQQKDENILFLSDTTELLNKIIDDSDSPFIYEKTGTRINNYMIDEFQDTSAMQWKNFKPLINESLGNNNANLIVGDVKQSIYRWRNSDWRLMEEQLTSDNELKNRIKEESLDTNWRSDANIIRFNNAFFHVAAQLLQKDYNAGLEQFANEQYVKYADHKIIEVYSHVYQHVPVNKQKKNGKIDITFLSNEKEDDWKATALDRLPKQIEQLQDEGFALKDIAILVRYNHEAVAVAEALLKYREDHPRSTYKYDIISNEALKIANAQSVKAIIALLRWLNNQNDLTKKMLALYEFYRFHRKESATEALHLILNDNPDIDFPDHIKTKLESLSFLPFYEMIESFFSLTKDVIHEQEKAYVQAFLDIALKSSTGSSSDLNNFLTWWDEKGHQKTLFSSDDQDAIRLVTIHKSKGLGFGAVIMPFAEWEFDHKANKQNIVWCRPNKEPFNTLNIVPLRYSKNLRDTIFWQEYFEEQLFTNIDNLNVLYVAFTRAKHRIIAFTPKPKQKSNKKNQEETTKEFKNVSDLLWGCFQPTQSIPSGSDRQFIDLHKHLFNDEGAVFSFGDSEAIEKSEKKLFTEQAKTAQWQSVPFDNRLKLRFSSMGYFSKDGKRDYGILMHDLISKVDTLHDIPQAVERKVLSGELSSSEKETIMKQLHDYLSISETSDWYSGNYTVLNEMQLLHPRFGFSRPDRVMLSGNMAIVVDYKFGLVEDNKYNRQVAYYVQKIKEMGYENVKGFVFYVTNGKVVSV